MSQYDLVINGSPYAVEIVNVSGGRASVMVNGELYEVELPVHRQAQAGQTGTPIAARPRPAVQQPKKAAPVSQAAAGGEVLTAPMPGHILSVSVRVGQSVNVGDTLLVMEAMKMENPIKSHVAGKISAVRVEKGQDVGVGDVLVVIGG